MKIRLIPILILTVTIICSCIRDDMGDYKTLESPISGLVLNVNDVDYTAVPKLSPTGRLTDTLEIKVDIPDTVANVRQISLFDANSKTDVTVGSVLKFKNNIAEINVVKAGVNQKYFVKLIYIAYPILYLVKSSDKVGDLTYMLNVETAQKLASSTYNDKYEGYIDLTTAQWNNIGLVNPNLQEWYHFNGGWWPEQSSGSFTLTPEYFPETPNRFICWGPWADWIWTNNNPAIVSPGYWKVNYNSTSGQLDLLETQWAIRGTATNNTTIALTYNSTTKTWNNENVALKAGTFKFVTIPVSPNDPVIGYGSSLSNILSGRLSTTGNDIKIATDGNYKINISFVPPPRYTFSVVKQ